MTEFLFGENCYFCQSKFGSTHCLLPYQLVVTYVPPSDPMARIIDIAEIHTNYGISALQTNLEALNWIASRPGSRADSFQAGVSISGSQAWSDQMNVATGQLMPTASSSLTSHDRTRSPSNFSDWITNQLSEIGSAGVPVQSSHHSNRTPQLKATIATVPLDEKDEVDHHMMNYERTPKALSPSTSGRKELTKVESSREDRNHLINDLVMMAVTAFNMHKVSRDYIKTNTLKESLQYESNIQSRIGAKYVKSKNTSLDGNKALAKEIVGTHQLDEIHSWESSKTTIRKAFCLLNCRSFALPIKEKDDQRLGETLIKNFFLMLNTHSDVEGKDSTIIESVKFELSKNGHPSIFEWMKNQSSFIHSQALACEAVSYHGTMKERAKYKLETYPAVDDRLIEYINVNLQVFVNREIENAKDDLPRMPDETKHTTFFFKLASEFLRRNKGWQNENSFTGPQHLQKLEDSTGLQSLSSESYLTFSILKKIIDNFRIAYKQRYPKTIIQNE